MQASLFQIGPAIVYLTFENWMIKGCFIHTVTPQKPLEQRMIHQVYASSAVPTFIAKFFMYSEAFMVSYKDVLVRSTRVPVSDCWWLLW